MRASRKCCAVLVVVGAVAGLGADRPEPWRDASASLPPVTLAPDTPVTHESPDANKIVLVANDEPVVPTPLPPLAPAIPSAMSAKLEPRATTPVLHPPTPLADAPALVATPTARVYAINGLNLFGQSGFSSMVDRIRDGGYPDTRSGPWYQTSRFERDIRQLQREQPGTPVVVIGYSLGAYRARAIANRLSRDGVPVAMVGYVGADYLQNSASSMPGGTRVVNVTGNGFLLSGRNLFFRGTELPGANNTRLDVAHLDLPRQPQTVEALLNGMHAATGDVPATSEIAIAPPVETTVVSSSPAALAGTPAMVSSRGAYSRLLPMLTGPGLKR